VKYLLDQLVISRVGLELVQIEFFTHFESILPDKYQSEDNKYCFCLMNPFLRAVRMSISRFQVLTNEGIVSKGRAKEVGLYGVNRWLALIGR
jgi:hypothetical protein